MTRGSTPPSAAEVTRRLRLASVLADLKPDRRLDAKVGLDAAGVTSRRFSGAIAARWMVGGAGFEPATSAL
jgi:hypothetical protein